MNRETIEKEAFKYGCENQVGPAMGGELEKGFIAGAQWRIDSVWHKPSVYGEELTIGVEVIANTKTGYRFGEFGVIGYFNESIGFISASGFEYALPDVFEYAYLNDLRPEKKEVKSIKAMTYEEVKKQIIDILTKYSE